MGSHIHLTGNCWSETGAKLFVESGLNNNQEKIITQQNLAINCIYQYHILLSFTSEDCVFLYIYFFLKLFFIASSEQFF